MIQLIEHFALDGQFSLAAVVVTTILCTLGITLLVLRLLYALEIERGLKYAAFNLLQNLPFVRSLIQIRKRRVVAGIADSTNSQKTRINTTLTQQGETVDVIMKECIRLRNSDSKHTNMMSGTIYAPQDSQVFELCTKVYSLFAHTNPLHGDAFSSVCHMEAEIVSIAASMLGGKSDDDICGNLTSGGTESILSAIRTSRDYMRSTHGINRPEMIAAVSAHAAIYKAADYYNIKLILIGTDDCGRLSIPELKRKLNRNVILVYASAPSYPHGVIDSVENIAKCIEPWGCCLHVDACLGGFILPFARNVGPRNEEYPMYDFKIPQVTSMSVDTHKYGCAQKGSSVVLYKNRDLRKFQYTAVSSWTGGMYISPSQAGSRSGGLIAQTWAALKYFGREGYAKQAANILAASHRLRQQISKISSLEILGVDITMVVAWKSNDKDVDIYALNDVLGEMGWHLSVLHSPPALHLCITTANIPTLDVLISDLNAAVKRIKSGEYDVQNARAPIYGMANLMSNTNIVNDLLKDIQDVMDRS